MAIAWQDESLTWIFLFSFRDLFEAAKPGKKSSQDLYVAALQGWFLVLTSEISAFRLAISCMLVPDRARNDQNLAFKGRGH
jgi:hypothetical protein